MPPTIKTLDIKAFRGIPELNLPIEGKSLVIHGENGTGKSSIVEAFEFLFTGSISHLEGTQGISLTRHAPHVSFSPTDVEVSISFNPGNIEISRTFADAPVPPQSLESYFETAQRGTFILRRCQVLEFIASQPADRFRSLASIIGISPIDDIELEMMRMRDEIQGELDAVNQLVQTTLNSLSDELETPITSADHILPSINAKLEVSGLPILQSLDKVEEHAEEMYKSVKGASDADLLSSLNLSFQQSNQKLFDDQFEDRIRSLGNDVDELVKENAGVELALVDLLRSGSDVIEEEDLSICPVCAQVIDKDKVLAQIKKRLQTLQALSKKASDIRTAIGPLSRELSNAKSLMGQLTKSLSRINGVEIPSSAGLSETTVFSTGSQALKDASEFRAEFPSEKLISDIRAISNKWTLVNSEISAEVEKIGLTDEEKKMLEIVRLIGSAKENARQILKVNEEVAKLEILLERAHFLYGTFSQTKKNKISEIYSRIQQDIQQYYSLLHPDDPHTDIELLLSERRRASTELKMKSFDRELEDPRALTSEGHLDSLGLCIFLAFVKTFNSNCSLTILDDVVTTIDSRHRARICDLLFEHFSDCQFVITTHDGIWYKELCSSQRAYSVHGKFSNIEIIDWHVDTGPRLRNYRPKPEVIRDKITDNDKTGAANDTRQYLEWLLKTICERTNAKVPVNNWQSGTVNDLEPHADGRLRTLIGDSDFNDQVIKVFAELEKTVLFGNLLSHNNLQAEQVSIAEVEAFYLSVAAIHDLIICNNCEGFLTYVRGTKEYRCVNPKCNDQNVLPTK